MSDIKWHDTKYEMPGTYFDNESDNFTDFLLRYFLEPDRTEPLYGLGFLSNGKFIVVLSEDEEHDNQPSVTHWAQIFHIYD